MTLMGILTEGVSDSYVLLKQTTAEPVMWIVCSNNCLAIEWWFLRDLNPDIFANLVSTAKMIVIYWMR
jgi:hypothetical protein